MQENRATLRLLRLCNLLPVNLLQNFSSSTPQKLLSNSFAEAISIFAGRRLAQHHAAVRSRGHFVTMQFPIAPGCARSDRNFAASAHPPQQRALAISLCTTRLIIEKRERISHFVISR